MSAPTHRRTRAVQSQRLRNAARGFTMVELMVAMALGLLLLGVLVAMVVSTIGNRNELDKSSRQIENGRYAPARREAQGVVLKRFVGDPGVVVAADLDDALGGRGGIASWAGTARRPWRSPVSTTSAGRVCAGPHRAHWPAGLPSCPGLLKEPDYWHRIFRV